MTQQFLAQIQPFTFNWAPKQWAQCDGQILAIQQNTALFALIGTYYGGNGTVTFGLPDLRGRVPIHQGTDSGGDVYVIGEQGGAASVTLNSSQIPLHAHSFMGSSAQSTANQPVAGVALAKAYKASGTVPTFYGAMATPQPLNPASVSPYGQHGSHSNMQPYLAINWCIALAGIFPSRN